MVDCILCYLKNCIVPFFNEDFFRNLIITLLSTSLALIAGIITFIKQKNIDRRKNAKTNENIIHYYYILISRIQLAIHQERIFYEEFKNNYSENWDSQPILKIWGLEEKDRYFTEINQIELFKAMNDKFDFNSDTFKAYLNIYTHIGSFRVKSQMILDEINRLIQENFQLRKKFLTEQRNLHTKILLYIKGLPHNDNDSFNRELKYFYDNTLSKGGVLDIQKMYYNSLEPFKKIIEENLNKNFCVELLPIFNEFVFVIIDLKSLLKEGIKMVDDYILELEEVEKDFKANYDRILKYAT